MPDHKVKKTTGLSCGGLVIGHSEEVETIDKSFAENFANRSLIRDVGAKISAMFFGERIEKNTIKTLSLAEQKVKLIEEQTGRHEIPMKTAVSIIENAGLEDSSFLREMWANMLANASTNKERVNSNYPEILKQLSEKEVLFLEILFNALNLEKINNPNSDIKKRGVKKKSFIQNLNISDEEYEEITDNLLRLKLINNGEGDEEDAKDSSYAALHMKKGLILITQLGWSFVKVCKFEIPSNESNL